MVDEAQAAQAVEAKAAKEAKAVAKAAAMMRAASAEASAEVDAAKVRFAIHSSLYERPSEPTLNPFSPARSLT